MFENSRGPAIKLIIITALSFNLSVVAAQAEDFYIGGNIGVSQFDGTADADANQFGNVIAVPAEISINGLPFDTTETSWGAYAGWRVKNWFALEVGCVDLGDSGRESPIFLTPGGAIVNNGTSLNVEELYLATRFTAPLSPKISANWIVGISKATFDTQGSLPILTGPGFPVFGLEHIPFASPGDKTGLIWGFGFNWQLNKRFALDVDYRQHNTQVLDIDTLTLGVTISM